MTILAARRVLPPDLMTPANASKPFMNDTGPDAVPPPASTSFDERMEDRFDPVPDPNLNNIPSVLASVRIDSIVSWTAVDEAGRALRRLLEAAVEPHGAVERALLIDQQVLQVVTERLQVVFRGEILLLARPGGNRVDHPAHQLPNGPLTLRRADLPPEVLGHHDVRGLLRPELRKLNIPLLENEFTPLVGNDGGAQLPLDLVKRIDAVLGKGA